MLSEVVFKHPVHKVDAQDRMTLAELMRKQGYDGKSDDLYPDAIKAHRCGIGSLEGSPQAVDGEFDVSENFLRSMKGGPRIVRGDAVFFNNKIRSLEGVPKHSRGLFLGLNDIRSIKGIGSLIEQVNGKLDLRDNPFKGNALGILRIALVDMVRMDNTKVQEIINRALKRRVRGICSSEEIMECQSELIDADLEEWAKL